MGQRTPRRTSPGAGRASLVRATWASALAAVFAGLGPLAAARDGADAPLARTGPASWEERVELDARLVVTPAGARQALAALDGEGRPALTDPAERAAALFALGMAADRGARARLESVAGFGQIDERRAAALALGAARVGESTLETLAQEAEPEVAAAAFLGLVVARSPRAADLAVALSASRGDLAAEYAAITAFARDRKDAGAVAEGRVPSEYLDLRWRAARDYGLIDGRSWRGRVLQHLASDDVFVDDVVLPSLVDVRHPGVRDHLATLLLERPSPAVFAACLEVLPAELERMLAHDLFTPPDAAYWERAMEVLERRGPDPADAQFLMLALRDGRVARHAAALLAEVGEPQGWEILRGDLAAEDPALRRAAVRALAASKEPERIEELERLIRDPDAGVRAAALVGRAREGERIAGDAVRDALLGEPQERDAVVGELLESRRAPRIRALLEEHFEFLEGEERLRAALILCLPGRVGPRDVVRAALESENAGPHAAAAVRVLADEPSDEELDLLLRLFPTGTDAALDRAVARALLELQVANGAVFLRAALWREPWHRSVLAGYLLASQGGIHTLHEELQAAPTSARSRDLRRIGYAIGSWGGPQQVEVLARRRTSDDPALQGAYLGALGSRTY